jgi:putative hemolysin
VRAAQRLRHTVFVEEMGARPPPSPLMADRYEADRFDDFCDHLLVRAFSGHSDQNGVVVGTYRVLGPSAAMRAGGLYTDAAFDLTPLSTLRARTVEIGRSCVHPNWRSGAVIMALWSELGRYMSKHKLDTMIGCASVSIQDQRYNAQHLWHRLRATYLAAPEWQVRPLVPLKMDADAFMQASNLGKAGALDTPPLIKGYLRCGARVLGPPAFDAIFRSADLPIMLRLAELSPVYRRHFLGC